jgi:hypothetical protein
MRNRLSEAISTAACLGLSVVIFTAGAVAQPQPKLPAYCSTADLISNNSKDCLPPGGTFTIGPGVVNDVQGNAQSGLWLTYRASIGPGRPDTTYIVFCRTDGQLNSQSPMVCFARDSSTINVLSKPDGVK